MAAAAVGCLAGLFAGVYLAVRTGLGARSTVASAVVNHTGCRLQPAHFVAAVVDSKAHEDGGFSRDASHTGVSSSPRSTASSLEVAAAPPDRKVGRIIF